MFTFLYYDQHLCPCCAAGNLTPPIRAKNAPSRHCGASVIALCSVCSGGLGYCYIFEVFRLDALAKALSVIATATWLGGWVSVTLRYCIKTAKPIEKLFRPSESPIILVY